VDGTPGSGNKAAFSNFSDERGLRTLTIEAFLMITDAYPKELL